MFTPTSNRAVAVLDPCALASRDRSCHSRHTDHSGSLGQIISLQFVHVVVPRTIVVAPLSLWECGLWPESQTHCARSGDF